MWNHYNSDDHRTNNNSEGYNSKLSKYFGDHPNIWKFITKIKQEETNVAIKLVHLDNNRLRSRGRNKQDIIQDLKFTQLKCKFLKKELNLLEFLDTISSIVHDYDS